jgi:hypothetical protein
MVAAPAFACSGPVRVPAARTRFCAMTKAIAADGGTGAYTAVITSAACADRGGRWCHNLPDGDAANLRPDCAAARRRIRQGPKYSPPAEKSLRRRKAACRTLVVMSN